MLYAIQQKNGSVAILVIAKEALKHLTIDDILKKDIPKGLKYKKIIAKDLPENRLFRNAWVYDLKTIGVNMPKAKAMHLDRIREMRDLKLKELDIEMLKVLSDPVKLKVIEDDKQLLRDLPKTFSLTKIKSASVLAKAWPLELEKHDIYK